jgi:hypothetical protein
MLKRKERDFEEDVDFERENDAKRPKTNGM